MKTVRLLLKYRRFKIGKQLRLKNLLAFELENNIGTPLNFFTPSYHNHSVIWIPHVLSSRSNLRSNLN